MNNCIEKFIIVMKREGICSAICIGVKKTFILFFRMFIKIGKQLSFFVIYRKKFRDLSKAWKGKRVYIFLNSLDWNYPLHQRPQQMAKASISKDDILSIYVTPKLENDKFSCIKRLRNQLYLLDIDYIKQINILSKYAKEVILYSTTTANHSLKKKIYYDHYIFDFIDDFSVWPNLTKTDMQQMKKEMHSADLLLVTASKLLDEGKRYNKKILLSPNAVNYSHFKSNKQYKIPTEILNKMKQKPVIGYYGAFSTWFDYELIHRSAMEKPDWIWLLIGRRLDDCLTKSGLLELLNVIYLGEVPYEKLPHYAGLFNVSIIPFHVNQITQATSPVKLFEYMALGHPILTASLTECKKYDSVFIYDSQQDFIRKIAYLLNLSSEQILCNQTILKREALSNTWTQRFQEIDRKIQTETGGYHG